MLSKEEISKFVYEEIEKLTYRQIAEWLINECMDNQTYQTTIKNQEDIITTQRRRIKNLLERIKKE